MEQAIKPYIKKIHTHTHTHIDIHSLHTYIFIPLIKSLHKLLLNMEHVNKHQRTHDT
jgi:hypothetical protein